MDRQITLFKNVDVGDVPPTPTTRYFNHSNLVKVREKLIGYASRYGFPISYIQEQNGQLVQNIFPMKKTENQQISTSSKTELGLHTEAAFHPYKPSAVLLLCLRGDSRVATTFAYVDEIVKHLSKDTVDVLSQPWFITSLDESFRTKDESDMELFCTILRKRNKTDKQIEEFTYDQVLMKGVNTQASEALVELETAIKKSINEIVLETGDLLVFNNRTTIHGRGPFSPRYDGTDRWLQRILSIDSAVPRQHKSGHTITTKFGTKTKVL